MGSSKAYDSSQATQVAPDLNSGVTRLDGDTNTVYSKGEIIGDRYRLEREIGRGGMGVVWVAHSLVLGVDVAVKLIRGSETGPEGASRMAREANAAARVAHPALVRVFDFGWTRQGDPFLVMELIRGEPLSETLLRQQSIPAIRAVQILLPIADGLRLAHERSIVHRDIKPGNILVSHDPESLPQPKLLDFGIAKVGQSGEGKLTQYGVVLGSPEYMSPEQALGLDDVDARSDVWSFGIALYELVTGTVPFRRPNYNALMQLIINEAPEPMTGQGGADEALWHIVSRSLEKDPNRRWSGMKEFGTALASWLYQQGVKEDISGNSLRAVWLNHGLFVPSGPRHSSLPPRLLNALSTLGNHAESIGQTTAVKRVRRLIATRQRSNFLLAAGVSFVVVLLLVLWATRAPDAANEAELGAELTGAHPTPTEPVATTDPNADGRQPDAPTPTAESSSGTESASNEAPATPNTARRPAKPTRPAPAIKPKAKAERDFGF